MNGARVNLATRPFANERPVRRTTLLIWILAVGLLAINVFLYQRHLSGQHEQRQALQSLQEGIASEEISIRELEQYLTTLGIERQNQKVVFLNGEIAKRTFSWSRLFDRLEEVLPAKVRLHRVSPKVVQESRRFAKVDRDFSGDLVSIDVGGDSPDSEDLLQFLDNMFEHPSFAVPNLMSENEGNDNRLKFVLNVLYLPSAVGQDLAGVPTVASEEATASEPATEVEP